MILGLGVALAVLFVILAVAGGLGKAGIILMFGPVPLLLVGTTLLAVGAMMTEQQRAALSQSARCPACGSALSPTPAGFVCARCGPVRPHPVEFK